MWLAGGGVPRRAVLGATDSIGYAAVDGRFTQRPARDCPSRAGLTSRKLHSRTTTSRNLHHPEKSRRQRGGSSKKCSDKVSREGRRADGSSPVSTDYSQGRRVRRATLPPSISSLIVAFLPASGLRSNRGVPGPGGSLFPAETRMTRYVRESGLATAGRKTTSTLVPALLRPRCGQSANDNPTNSGASVDGAFRPSSLLR